MADVRKLELFKSLFKGREDVYPLFWQNRAGKKGYSPVCENRFNKELCGFRCDDCENQKFVPLSDPIIEKHFSGRDLMGRYPLLLDGTCFWLAVDFDDHEGNGLRNPLEDAKSFMAVCELHEIHVYLERSRSGNGYHGWIFFESAVPAWKARLVMFALLKEAQAIDEDSDHSSFDRLFPNQDTLSGKCLGNLIALPFYGKALKDGNSTFLDKDLKPITTDSDIITLMESVERVSEATLDWIIEEWKLVREEPRHPVEYTPPDDLGNREGLKRMLKGCSFFEYCNVNQKILSEPLWYDMASNLCRFDGGLEKFHDLSGRHPEYSTKGTDKKFDHAFKASGPVTCSKIRKDGYACNMKKGCGVESPAGLGTVPKTESKTMPKKEIYVDDIPPPQDKVEPFPVDIMPGCLKDLVTQGAKATHCPPDFIAVFTLVALGSAIGNKMVSQIKSGWELKANIYLGLVAKTGTGKTPAQKIATRPMKELQKIMAIEYGEEFKKYERSVAEWEVKCAEAKKSSEPKPPKPEEVFMDEIYTSDTTVEALAQMLERNPQGITITLDELSAWLNGLNQYKPGGKGSDQEAFLSLWSGVTTKINRKDKPPIIIDSPFLSVMGSLPPTMLKTLADEKGRGENGFIHRILFSYPDPVKQEWTEDIISPEVLTGYYNLFMKLRGMTAQTMTLDQDAYAIWVKCYNEFQTEKNKPDFPENLHGPWAKMDQQLAKIALIIHCVRLALGETNSEKIDARSMATAGAIINYFQSHARRVYDQLTESEEDKQFRQIIAWKNKHSRGEVTAREILRATLCKNIEEVIAMFNIMQKRQIGTIQEIPGRGGKTIKFLFGV